MAYREQRKFEKGGGSGVGKSPNAFWSKEGELRKETVALAKVREKSLKLVNWRGEE